MEEIVLTKEKIAANCKVSQQFINEGKIKFGLDSMDYIEGTLTAQIETFILSRLNETQIIKIDRKPQGFIDWILRRNQHFEFEIKCKEIMKNPPKLKESTFMYIV